MKTSDSCPAVVYQQCVGLFVNLHRRQKGAELNHTLCTARTCCVTAEQMHHVSCGVTKILPGDVVLVLLKNMTKMHKKKRKNVTFRVTSGQNKSRLRVDLHVALQIIECNIFYFVLCIDGQLAFELVLYSL